jgi:iron complex transport system ATP-binding protein
LGAEDRRIIVELISHLVRSGTCSALISLHDLAVAEQFDRVLLIDEGRVRADGSPADVLSSPELSAAFRIARCGSEWRIRPPADPRSSP